MVTDFFLEQKMSQFIIVFFEDRSCRTSVLVFTQRQFRGSSLNRARSIGRWMVVVLKKQVLLLQKWLIIKWSRLRIEWPLFQCECVVRMARPMMICTSGGLCRLYIRVCGLAWLCKSEPRVHWPIASFVLRPSITVIFDSRFVFNRPSGSVFG